MWAKPWWPAEGIRHLLKYVFREATWEHIRGPIGWTGVPNRCLVYRVRYHAVEADSRGEEKLRVVDSEDTVIAIVEAWGRHVWRDADWCSRGRLCSRMKKKNILLDVILHVGESKNKKEGNRKLLGPRSGLLRPWRVAYKTANKGPKMNQRMDSKIGPI